LTISVALADADILFSRTLRDYFLYLADAGAIEIRWGQRILDDVAQPAQRETGLSRAAPTGSKR
jgi:hypothetical protein